MIDVSDRFNSLIEEILDAVGNGSSVRVGDFIVTRSEKSVSVEQHGDIIGAWSNSDYGRTMVVAETFWAALKKRAIRASVEVEG